MSLSLTSTHSSSSERAGKRGHLGIGIVIVILLLLGGGGWYYFFGQKPKIAFTVPLKTEPGEYSEGRTWSIGDGSQIIMLASGELKLCSLTDGKVLWSAKIPALVEVDPQWQSGLNSRFVKLQEWATSLGEKRTALTTQQAIKAFNEEAAKYQAELASTRKDAAKPPPPKPKSLDEDEEEWPDDEKVPALGNATGIKDRISTARAIAGNAAAQTEAAQKVGGTFIPKPPAAPALKPTNVPDFSGRTAVTPKFNAVVSPEAKILQGRIDKRKTALTAMDATILRKARLAKTPLALGEVQELQAKRATLAAEQQADEAEVARLRGVAAPAPKSTAPAAPIAAVPALVPPGKAPAPVAAIPAAPAPGAIDASEDDDDFGYMRQGPPQLAVLGDRVWLVEGPRALSFSLADGKLTAEARLAGPMARVFAHESFIYVVADAGMRARQITRIDTAGATQSMYLAAPPREMAFTFSQETGYRVNVQAHRVEFTGAGGSLARADIRLVARKTKMRDLIKPGTEKQLTETIEKSAAHSAEEMMAMVKLLETDSLVASGQSKEEVDESTYEVTITRPFDTSLPAWKGTLQGRVQILSTPTLDLVTAGTKLFAIDRTNKKLWETTLGAAMPQRNDDSAWEMEPAPMLEEGGRIVFADGAFLTSIQATTGQVLWRLPNVGIRKVLSDADSNLYIQTDNLSADTLKYVTTADITPPTASTIKVDSESGKILWTAEKFEDVWVSGKDVYALRHFANGVDAETQVFDPKNVPEGRIKIYKLSRSSGKPTWDWFQTRLPRNVIAHGKYVAILFGNELQVIHSIAL